MPNKCVKLYNYDSVLDRYYTALITKGGISNIKNMHIPVSDVFYVQKAIEMNTGIKYSPVSYTHLTLPTIYSV